MKRFLKGMLNIATILTLGLTILGGVFLALEPELQQKIPLELREILILMFANGGLGTFLVISRVLVERNKVDSDKKIGLLTSKLLDLVKKIEDIEYKSQVKEKQFTETINKMNDKLDVDLKIKQSNPMIKKHLKEEIEKVLGD